MNRDELKIKLDEAGVRESRYEIYPISNFEDKCLLVKKWRRWEVYYSERGNKYELKVFKTEEEACEYFYWWMVEEEALTKRLNIRDHNRRYEININRERLKIKLDELGIPERCYDLYKVNVNGRYALTEDVGKWGFYYFNMRDENDNRDENITAEELKIKLYNEGFPKHCYDLYNDNVMDQFILLKIENKWEVFYSERFSKIEVKFFDTEEIACDYMYWRIVEENAIRKKLKINW